MREPTPDTLTQRLGRLERALRRWAVLASAAVAALATVAQAAAQDLPAQVQRYQRTLEQVCETQVTPQLVRLYQEAARAVDAAKYGGGQNSNFWGLKTPEHAYLDECTQTDGGTER